MNEPRRPPIDRINEERPPAGSDEASLPVFVTAAISVFMIVLLVWLFGPGGVATARARPPRTPATGITAPPAQNAHQQLPDRQATPQQQNRDQASKSVKHRQ